MSMLEKSSHHSPRISRLQAYSFWPRTGSKPPRQHFSYFYLDQNFQHCICGGLPLLVHLAYMQVCGMGAVNSVFKVWGNLCVKTTFQNLILYVSDTDPISITFFFFFAICIMSWDNFRFEVFVFVQFDFVWGLW